MSASQLDSALMDIDLAALPDDVEALQKLVRTLAAERTNLHEAQDEIERLHLKKLQRSHFGRRAEQLDDDQPQLGLEDLNSDLARIDASPLFPQAETGTSKAQDERCAVRPEVGLPQPQSIDAKCKDWTLTW